MAAALEILLKLPADMVGQEFSLFTQLVDKGGAPVHPQLSSFELPEWPPPTRRQPALVSV